MPVKSPDCFLGIVTQPTDSRLSETKAQPAIYLEGLISVIVTGNMQDSWSKWRFRLEVIDEGENLWRMRRVQ